jgi:hypothetical protein
MSGLFEHLAADDEMGRIARRKAIAVATKRVNDRYAEFVLSEDDTEAITERLDLVADEFDQAVRDACDEQGVEDSGPIVAAIRKSFLDKAANCDCGEGCECKRGECDCGTKEAASEDMPEWLEEHFEEKNEEGASKEEEDEGVAEEEDEDEKAKESSVKEARRPKMCPYHKELVNASLQVGEPQYAAFSSLVGSDAHCDGGYDDKCNFKPAMVTQSYWDEKEQARLERKEQRELERQQAEQQSHEISPDEAAEEPVAEAVEDQASLSELDGAPSAVGEGEEIVEMETEVAPEPVLASSRWEITAAPKDGDSWEKNESVEQPEGPSPKMDKSKWNGLDPIDTDAGPYQTVQQDVTEGPDYSKQDNLGIATVEAVTEYTDAVTEQEELPTATNIDDAGFNSDKNIETHHTDTFDNDGQVEPVTQEVMANFQPKTSEEALNLHTADLLSDAKGFGQGIVDGTKDLGNAALDVATAPAKAIADIGDAAGRAFNENILEATPESQLQQPNMGLMQPGMPPQPPVPAQPAPQMNQTPQEAMQQPQVQMSPDAQKFFQMNKGSAAHKIKEEDGKFYVVEDGDEKAAGPFDSEKEAKERATELNAMENLEKEASPKTEHEKSEKVNKELAESAEKVDEEVLGKLPHNEKKADLNGWQKLPGMDENTSGADTDIADFTTYYAHDNGTRVERVISVERHGTSPEGVVNTGPLDYEDSPEGARFALTETHRIEYPDGSGDMEMLDPPGDATYKDSLEEAVAEAQRLSSEDISSILG